MMDIVCEIADLLGSDFCSGCNKDAFSKSYISNEIKRMNSFFDKSTTNLIKIEKSKCFSIHVLELNDYREISRIKIAIKSKSGNRALNFIMNTREQSDLLL